MMGSSHLFASFFCHYSGMITRCSTWFPMWCYVIRFLIINLKLALPIRCAFQLPLQHALILHISSALDFGFVRTRGSDLELCTCQSRQPCLVTQHKNITPFIWCTSAKRRARIDTEISCSDSSLALRTYVLITRDSSTECSLNHMVAEWCRSSARTGRGQVARRKDGELNRDATS